MIPTRRRTLHAVRTAALTTLAGCLTDSQSNSQQSTEKYQLTDEVQFPTIAIPHGSHLSDVLYGHVWLCLVLCKDEV